MILPGVPLDQVAESNLHDLIGSATRERRGVDFKQTLPGSTDDDKQEFRADATSFANAGGGDLVFGIREEEGAAVEIKPLEGDADAAVLRLEQMLRSGVEPRLLGVRTHPVAVDGGWVLIVRIPASWAGPHAVASRSQGAYRFYTRNSAGKHQLDIAEIRSAFLGADSVARRARHWQTERLGHVVARDTPITLRDSPTIVVHLVPLAAEQTVDPGSIIDSGIFMPLGLTADVTRWNIDGLLAYALDSDGLGLGYAQLYRDGHLETANAILLDHIRPPDGSQNTMNGISIEHALINGIANPLRALQIVGAQPPFAVLVALVGALGREVVNPYYLPMPVRAPIDRELLLLPDVICEGFDWDRGRGMRPIIDALWQASGTRGSPSYDPTGAWKPSN